MEPTLRDFNILFVSFVIYNHTLNWRNLRKSVIRQKTNNKNTNVGIFVVGILPNGFVGILFLMVTFVGIFVWHFFSISNKSWWIPSNLVLYNIRTCLLDIIVRLYVYLIGEARCMKCETKDDITRGILLDFLSPNQSNIITIHPHNELDLLI